MRGEKQPARHFARSLFQSLARCLALIWLAPAMLFNIDWSGHGSWQANAAAVLMILGSALFIEGALRMRSLVMTPICVVAALFLVYVNTKQAMRVLSLSGEAVSEAKMADLASASHVASQSSHLLARRKVQVELAGETPVGALEAQMQALQLSDLRAWNATKACEDVTAKASGLFCTRVAETRARIEAAKERDKIDAQIAALPVPKVASAGAEAPVVDAYISNAVALLREAGFKPSERLVRAEEAMTRAFSFELLAALGPTCWLAFVNMLAVGAAVGRRLPPRPPAKPLPTGGDKAPALPDNADELDRCIADAFEPDPAGVMLAKDIRPVVLAWFERQGRGKPVVKALWAKMRERFKHDPNGGRPRYIGLKVRVKGPPRLAVVPAA